MFLKAPSIALPPASHFRRRAGILALVGLLAACSGAPENGGVRVSEAGELAVEHRDRADALVIGPTAPTAQSARMPIFEPAAGPVGSEVELWMDGLSRNADFYIGFGSMQGHTIVQGAESDEEGVLTTRLSIPSTASVNRSHYFFVADQLQMPLSVSMPFLVTGPDGRVEIRGEVGEAEGACVMVLGGEEEFYALRGDLPSLSLGDRVVVRGRVALDGGCAEGLTIDVETVVTQR